MLIQDNLDVLILVKKSTWMLVFILGLVKTKLLFMSGGGKENMGCVEAAKKIKEQLGMNAVGYESEGTAHEFHTWRRSLHEIAQLLFK